MIIQKRKDPLQVESFRQSLASLDNFRELKKTYDLEIKLTNRNKPEFWDKLLAKSIGFNQQGPMTKDRIKTAVNFLPNGAYEILDIGAGHGFIVELIQKSQRDAFICGVDISPLGIEKLNSQFKGEFKIGDVREIPYPSNKFDAVFALEVVEHILPRDTFKALGELKRVIKPGGFFIVSVPTNERIDDFSKNQSGHLRVYTPALIRAELILAGFKFLKWKKLYAFNRFYKLKSMIASFFPQKFQPNNVVILARKE